MIGMIIGATAIGITLGLLGSGGSILTVPILVYVLGHGDKAAIAESLAIVGGIAFVGAVPYARAHQIDWRSVLYFGLPGMGGTYAGAWLAKFVSGPFQLVLFALVMLFAAVLMFRSSHEKSGEGDPEHSLRNPHPAWQIVLEGLAVGILTGLVGVGGGFLVVPALVLLGGLPMRLAIGTSLVVIGLKSFSGFFKYMHVLEELHASVDWTTIAVFVGVGIVGTLIGKELNQRINQRVLRQSFAAFLLIMGTLVLSHEIPNLFVNPNNTIPPAESHTLVVRKNISNSFAISGDISPQSASQQ